MALFIVATDFTEAAGNAASYACKLALSQNAELMVLHCYDIPIMFSDVPIPSPVIDAEQMAEDAMKNLLLSLHDSFPQLTISSKVVFGNLVDAIDDYAEAVEAPMLILAGNSYSEENPAWSDSTLLQTLRHLKYPVLAIPEETAYTDVRKIGFAYDNKYEGSDLALVELREIAIRTGAELHVLYAQPEIVMDGVDTEINNAAKNILAAADPLYHVYYEHNIDDAIHDFASKFNIDWLAIIPRKHSFFENIFHKSHTKVMVNEAHIPVLALHHT